MTKVIEYMVISHTRRDKLVEDVNERIGLGWQPWGGLQVSETTNQPISFTQAMALYEPEPVRATAPMSIVKEEVKKAERNKPTAHSR